MSYNNVEANTRVDIVNLFKQHFSSVYELSKSNNYKVNTVNSNYNIYENSLLIIYFHSEYIYSLMVVFNE